MAEIVVGLALFIIGVLLMIYPKKICKMVAKKLNEDLEFEPPKLLLEILMIMGVLIMMTGFEAMK